MSNWTSFISMNWSNGRDGVRSNSGPRTLTLFCVFAPRSINGALKTRVPADVGKGVFWEGTLIYNYLYDDKGNARCVPVYLADSNDKGIPAVLKGYPRFHLNKFSLDDSGSDYDNLYRLLTRQPGVGKAGIGEVHRLPPLTQGKRETDFIEANTQRHWRGQRGHESNPFNS